MSAPKKKTTNKKAPARKSGSTSKKTGTKVKTPKKKAVRAKKTSQKAVKIKVRNVADRPSADFYPYNPSKHDDFKWQQARFEKLLKGFDDVHQELIKKAFAFAKDRHCKMSRANGIPYIIHPVRIANILLDEWNETRPDIVAASLLHDVVEDTQTTVREIKDAFGDDVGKLIDGITMWKGSETPEVYLKRVARGPQGLRLIKCADVLDNLRSWHECPPELADKFPRWWRQAKDYVVPMAEKTHQPSAETIFAIIEDPWYLKKANML